MRQRAKEWASRLFISRCGAARAALAPSPEPEVGQILTEGRNFFVKKVCKPKKFCTFMALLNSNIENKKK